MASLPPPLNFSEATKPFAMRTAFQSPPEVASRARNLSTCSSQKY